MGTVAQPSAGYGSETIALSLQSGTWHQARRYSSSVWAKTLRALHPPTAVRPKRCLRTNCRVLAASFNRSGALQKICRRAFWPTTDNDRHETPTIAKNANDRLKKTTM